MIDADILSYALYDQSPAHVDSWKIIERAARREIDVHITAISILETYNALYWFYKVRPRSSLLQKISTTLDTLTTIPPSLDGVTLAARENLPLGDGFLLATALENRIPIIISNDKHVAKAAPKFGLIVENPLSIKTRSLLSRRTASGIDR